MKHCLSIFLYLFTLTATAQNLFSPDGGMDHYDKTCKLTLDQSDINIYYDLIFLKDSAKTGQYTQCQTVLMASNNYIRFGDYNRIRLDSINDFCAESRKNAKNKEAQKTFYDAIDMYGFNFSIVILTDLWKNETTIQLEKLKKYEFTMPRPKIEWHLAANDTIINGIACKKALCRYAGRNYIAWYADSISFPYGPYVFSGLPGLIIKIYDTKLNWVFTFKGMEKPKQLRDIYIYNDKELIKTTREKALKAYRNEIENYRNLSIEVFKVKINGKTPPANFPKQSSNIIEQDF